MGLRSLWMVLAMAACGDAVADPIRIPRAAPDGGSDREQDGGWHERERDEVAGPDVPDTAYCSEAADWDEDLARAEYRLFERINDQRRDGVQCEDRDEGELAPFQLVPELRCSARLHSKYMFEQDDFDEVTRDGVDPAERVAATGLAAASVEESIAESGSDVDDVLRNLLGRRNPCDNLRSSELTLIGIGHYEELWTLDFAQP